MKKLLESEYLIIFIKVVYYHFYINCLSVKLLESKHCILFINISNNIYNINQSFIMILSLNFSNQSLINHNSIKLPGGEYIILKPKIYDDFVINSFMILIINEL